MQQIVISSGTDRRLRARVRDSLGYRDTRALITLFLLVQIFDLATTAYALNTGRFSEANPWLAASVTAHPFVMYLVKFGIAMGVVSIVLLLRLRWRLRRAVLILFTVTSLVAPLANLARITGVI